MKGRLTDGIVRIDGGTESGKLGKGRKADKQHKG